MAIPTPLSNNEIANKSNEIIKHNNAPDIIPGFIIGNVILLKTTKRFPPKLLPASSRDISKLYKDDETDKNANGNVIKNSFGLDLLQ